MADQSKQDHPREDLPEENPVDSELNGLLRFLPARWVGLAQLARLDRPIGTWLLFWPCFWGMALASADKNAYPPAMMVALFALGAVVMRGAGCTFNDIVDREIDVKISRTAQRPLPMGCVSVTGAWGFLVAQALIGLAILLFFNMLTILLGFAALALVAIYPFMKRVTYWPQLFLGLTFNWGALMGYAALTGQISHAALALYAAGIFWTLGYDTIYAHQDRAEDALIGVKSAALRLGRHTRHALVIFYASSVLLLGLAGYWGGLTALFWPGLSVVAYHLAMQIYELDIDDVDQCLRLFRRNRDTGLIIGASILLGTF